jgi:gluconate 5-dehydrogenase
MDLTKSLFDLTGKRALVTGGVHGLGMAMAKGLGHAGAELIVNNYSSDMLKEAKEEYESEGLKVHTYVFDVPITEAL